MRFLPRYMDPNTHNQPVVLQDCRIPYDRFKRLKSNRVDVRNGHHVKHRKPEI